ncbi:MAG: DUF2130 domain-containing protein [Planctomycetes bacterium]|nr:DUF2130 domain-containing protein [Planctomycetota bacterium]
MSDDTVKCPECGFEIALSAALTGGIRESLRSEIEAEALALERELEVKQEEISRREREVARQGRSIADDVDKRVGEEIAKVRKEQFALAAEAVSVKTKSLEEELAKKAEAVKAAELKELGFLKKERELEEKTERLELDVERKLNEERKKISSEARRQAEEEQQLKIREKDDLVISLKDKLEDMRRKMEQGSQERQGEMLEEELKELLERSFPRDRFDDVAKGKRGADIVQIVHGPTGKVCGKILWESKNTKEFSKGWIEKLKKDQADASAEFAILMTVAMPRDVRDFDLCNDVWITNYKCAIGLCTSLRGGLINVARERIVAIGQESMKDVVYKYVTGQEFNRRIKRIVDAYVQMQTDLESEKRALTKIWKKREKQISVVLDNAAEMRGEIEGLVGGDKVLPEAGMLELDSIAGDVDVE